MSKIANIPQKFLSKIRQVVNIDYMLLFIATMIIANPIVQLIDAGLSNFGIYRKIKVTYQDMLSRIKNMFVQSGGV